MSAYIRVTRGDPAGMYLQGARRLAHTGKVEAVGEDGTTVDISNAVALLEMECKMGAAELLRVTVLAFEVES